MGSGHGCLEAPIQGKKNKNKSIDIRAVGVGVGTGLQGPEEKAWVSTGGIQAGFTEEVASDLDTKRKRRVF